MRSDQVVNISIFSIGYKRQIVRICIKVKQKGFKTDLSKIFQKVELALLVVAGSKGETSFPDKIYYHLEPKAYRGFLKGMKV